MAVSVGAGSFPLWIGPGSSADRIERALRALLEARDALAAEALPGPSLRRIDDLGDLLDRPAGVRDATGGRGRLLLETASLPIEDVGIVRRFCERHPEWELVLLGECELERLARLAPPAGTRHLREPLDLVGLAHLALAPGEEPASPPPPAIVPAPAGEQPRAEAPDPDRERIGAELAFVLAVLDEQGEGAAELGPTLALCAERARALRGGDPALELVDVGTLLEELATGVALGGEDAPRFLFRSEGSLWIHAPREPLRRALETLVRLARELAPSSTVVRVLADSESGELPDPAAGVVLAVEFPSDALDGEGTEHVPADLLEHVDGALREEARHAFRELRRLGGGVRLDPYRPGRHRLAIHLARIADRVPGSDVSALEPIGGEGELVLPAGNPDDPFS